MLKIFTNPARLAQAFPDYSLIDVNDAFFSKEILLDGLTQLDRQYIEELEQARFISDTRIETRDKMIANVTCISTGTKTIINILHVGSKKKPYAVDVTECGPNFIPKAFELADEFNVPILIMHTKLLGLPDKPMTVDGRTVNTAMELCDAVINGVLAYVG